MLYCNLGSISSHYIRNVVKAGNFWTIPEVLVSWHVDVTIFMLYIFGPLVQQCVNIVLLRLSQLLEHNILVDMSTMSQPVD